MSKQTHRILVVYIIYIYVPLFYAYELSESIKLNPITSPLTHISSNNHIKS
jgi:hypothetical protein